MSTTRYTCCDQNRRPAVDAHPVLNGIDWLEVLDRDAPVEAMRQRTLLVRLLKAVPAGITPANVAISGGERIRHIDIDWVGVANTPPAEATPAEQALFAALPEPEKVLVVRTDMAGDFSTYRLTLSRGQGSELPLTDFDPRLSAVDFAFKVECPSDFDCAPNHDCPPEAKPDPDLNYLARDYASLRRLLVDRMSQQMPGWRDRSPADLATTLAELIAYIGDLKHYQLDAITTEAYLHSARRRSSLRRHALLVDYPMHEGCNARTWLHLEVSGAPFDLPAGIKFLTRNGALPTTIEPDSADERAARRAGALVFEPMQTLHLNADHNDFDFHTWGDSRCCLPRGATRATLRGHWPALAVDDVLIFEEVFGPRTGEAEDADPAHRHAVRLTGVQAFMPGENPGDPPAPLTDPLPDAVTGEIHPITEIQWHADDALPFALCLSAETDASHGSLLIDGVSIALGNNLLVDHGEYLADESLGTVPEPALYYPATGTDACTRIAREPLPPRFKPALAEGPVTHQGRVTRRVIENGVARSERVPFDPSASATAARQWRTADALPVVSLESSLDTLVEPWGARRDLLSSRPTDREFVLETEHDGRSRIRFGDDTHGRRPDAGTAFTASYRVGNGPAGNVGADSITHALTLESRIGAIRNPLPAVGGESPESAEQVRRRAPHAFRTQERAVTPADYAEVTERLDGVQRAAATLRWTGSWHTVFTTVDRDAGEPVTPAFADTVVTHLDRYRMAGHDLRVTEPIHVSLEIDMLVCVNPDYFRSHVREGLLDVFSRFARADGTRGLFHPDNFSFGQTVFLSPLYAAARTVAGVASVQVTRFHRQGQEDPTPLAEGFMRLGRLEIARLDNDPNFPEHGVLRLTLHGGK